MEIQYFGGNCLRLSTKKASVVIDDNLSELGAKSVTKAEDVALDTNASTVKVAKGGKLLIAQPGEYEVSYVSIQGIAARSHMDEEGQTSATIFKLQTDDIRIVVIGHIYPDLSDDQLEAIGTVDIMLIPVGNSGYTLDAIGALKIIKKLEPKIIIPTHYSDPKLKYEVPQHSLEEALKELAMEPSETTPKLKLKSNEIPENTQLIVLERQ